MASFYFWLLFGIVSHRRQMVPRCFKKIQLRFVEKQGMITMSSHKFPVNRLPIFLSAHGAIIFFTRKEGLYRIFIVAKWGIMVECG